MVGGVGGRGSGKERDLTREASAIFSPAPTEITIQTESYRIWWYSDHLRPLLFHTYNFYHIIPSNSNWIWLEPNASGKSQDKCSSLVICPLLNKIIAATSLLYNNCKWLDQKFAGDKVEFNKSMLVLNLLEKIFIVTLHITQIKFIIVISHNINLNLLISNVLLEEDH